jgi:hypothetical protein
MAEQSIYVELSSEDELAGETPAAKKQKLTIDRDSDFQAPRRRVKPTPVPEDESVAPSRRSARTSKPKKRSDTPDDELAGSPTPPSKAGRSSARKQTPKTTVKLRTGRRVKEDVFNEPDRLFGPQKSLLYRDDTDVLVRSYHL